MHVFLYEWITGGGLVEERGTLPTSLLSEGSAMLTALAADLVAIDDCQVSVMRDIRLDDLSLAGCEIIDVHSKPHHDEEIARLAASADHTLIVAPEFDKILLRTHELAREAGGNLLASTQEFVAITTDKNATALRCAQSGIPVPVATVLEADEEKLPSDFEYPAVLKPVDGAGSQNTLLVAGPNDEPPPYPWRRRLERFCPGMAVSVAFLCGPTHRVALPACRQNLSADGRMTYLGGSLLLEKDLAQRATQLADRVLDALPGALGFVGIDLVLGKSADGSEDFLIEANPRVTTSYVGLRAATDENLAAALITNTTAKTTSPKFRQEPLEFTSDGTLRTPTH